MAESKFLKAFVITFHTSDHHTLWLCYFQQKHFTASAFSFGIFTFLCSKLRKQFYFILLQNGNNWIVINTDC